jgi:hypothetical protein
MQRVNGKKTKTSSWPRYERTGGKGIGLQLPRWFQVEQKCSVKTDGMML